MAASAIRFYNPTFRSLWGDESHSFYLSQQPVSNITYNAIKEAHLPAYFILLSLWTNIFGTGEYNLRLLSILIGILAVITFFFFIKDIFDERAAAMSAIFLAFSPMAVMHSHEIRVYGLVLLLSILSSWMFWKLLYNRINSVLLLLYIFFTFLLGMTHLYALLLIFSQAIYLAYYYFTKKDLKPSLMVFIAQAVALMLIAPFYIKLFALNYTASMSQTADLAFSVFPIYLKPLLFIFVLTLGETVAPWNLMAVIPTIIAFGLIFISSVKYCKDNRIIYLLFMCLIPICIASFLKPSMPKYLIICLPFFLGIIGCALSMNKNKVMKRLIMIVCLSVFSLSIVNYYSFKEFHNSNQIEPWGKLSSLIKSRYKPGDVIIASNEYIGFNILNYYLNINDHNDFKLAFLRQIPLNITTQRIWYISHIVDERALSKEDKNKLNAIIYKNYSMITSESFIPYEETLVSKLPINRHKKGAVRIKLSLYIRKI